MEYDTNTREIIDDLSRYCLTLMEENAELKGNVRVLEGEIVRNTEEIKQLNALLMSKPIFHKNSELVPERNPSDD